MYRPQIWNSILPSILGRKSCRSPFRHFHAVDYCEIRTTTLGLTTQYYISTYFLRYPLEESP